MTDENANNEASAPRHVWEKTFEVRASREATWNAFADPETTARLLAPPDDAVQPTTAMSSTNTLLDMVPLETLSWRNERGDHRHSDMTVTLVDADHGCTITITRFGFGDDEAADIFNVSNALGWEHGIKDLILFVETGQIVKRHYDGCTRSALGMSYLEHASGVEVCEVGAVGLGSEAGLQRGDRLVRIGGAQVYTRSDIWALNAVHETGTELVVDFIRGTELMSSAGRTCSLDHRLVGE